MHWIKEVEIVALMTSRLISGRMDFPDYGMLDAMIASALKKLVSTHVHFRKNKKVNVEEQRAQKDDRFFRGTQNAYMICEHFRAGAAYKMTTSKISKYDGIKLYYQQAKFLQKDPAMLIYVKRQDSVQYQTVLALYDQETVRSNEPPS